MTLKWEDPPHVPGVRGQSSALTRFAQEAAELKARPDTWAVLMECSNPKAADNMAHRIRTGEFPQLESVEVTRRGRKLYVRWIEGREA